VRRVMESPALRRRAAPQPSRLWPHVPRSPTPLAAAATPSGVEPTARRSCARRGGRGGGGARPSPRRLCRRMPRHRQGTAGGGGTLHSERPCRCGRRGGGLVQGGGGVAGAPASTTCRERFSDLSTGGARTPRSPSAGQRPGASLSLCLCPRNDRPAAPTKISRGAPVELPLRDMPKARLPTEIGCLALRQRLL